MQGEFMSKESESQDLNRPTPDINIVSSVLDVKCSGVDLENQIQNDLNLPEGKTIAELLYDQTEK